MEEPRCRYCNHEIELVYRHKIDNRGECGETLEKYKCECNSAQPIIPILCHIRFPPCRNPAKYHIFKDSEKISMFLCEEHAKESETEFKDSGCIIKKLPPVSSPTLKSGVSTGAD